MDTDEVSHSNKSDRNVKSDNNSNTLTDVMFESNSSNYHCHTLHKDESKIEMAEQIEKSQS